MGTEILTDSSEWKQGNTEFMVRWCKQDEFSRKLKADDFRMTSTHRCLCFVPLPTDHPFPSFLPFSLSFPKAEALLGEVSEHRGVSGAGLGLSTQPLLLPSAPAASLLPVSRAGNGHHSF